MESKRETILKQKEEVELKVKQYKNKIKFLENCKQHLEKKLTVSALTIFVTWAAPSKAFLRRQIY